MSLRPFLLAFALAVLASSSELAAQMVHGPKIPTFNAVFGLNPQDKAATCQFLGSTAKGNILWPGEKAEFSFQLVNVSAAPLKAEGFAELIPYGTRGIPGDIWTPEMFKLEGSSRVPLAVELQPGEFKNFSVAPSIPERFGAFGLVVDLGASGRYFVTSFVRAFKPEGALERHSQIVTDVTDPDVLSRLGVNPNRLEIPIMLRSATRDYEKRLDELCAKLDAYKLDGMSILLQIGANNDASAQPLGRPRPHLEADGSMKDGKSDMTPMPQFDGEFKAFVKELLAREGWPKGPVSGVMLCNEPWEGISISGWGADMIRFRELYSKLGEAVDESRAEAGTDVLIGGCDSSSNTFDKLFGDGKTDFLKHLDFCSIHYQGMNPPSTYVSWRERKSLRGPVRTWDTESWIANTDDRVAAAIAACLSCGYERVVGVAAINIAYYDKKADIFVAPGKKQRLAYGHTWSLAASLSASQHFIGQRKFRELLFKNGLPWVIVFDGVSNPEDGTVVVIGDLGAVFGHDAVPFRNARGFAEIKRKPELQKRLAALPPDAPKQEREALERDIRHEVLSGASLALKADGTRFKLYDFYGNPLPASDGLIEIPLDGRGFFLRADGSNGSFAALLNALRVAKISGVEPLDKKLRDMLSPVDKDGSSFTLSLTNVLNKPVSGALSVSVEGLKIQEPERPLSFAPNETKALTFGVSGAARQDNSYKFKMSFDAGADGVSYHEEALHVNLIAKRSIAVDGSLDDWQGVLPQAIRGEGPGGPSLTEAAWLPFVKFEDDSVKGFSTGYLAYDKDYFYFAAKVADSTPDGGGLRFEKRDDEQFYYPQTSYSKDRKTVFNWPDGVRRYSYRMRPILPWAGDTVQIAFNAIPEKKDWLPFFPGTLPGYTGYQDSDYEYTLLKVADANGGGTEIWRTFVPGMPRKHFYPRQGASPFDGPVKDGKLAIVQTPAQRVVECAIPWSEIPEVKKRLDSGATVKFSFRVNDDKSSNCLELAKDRSVSKNNYLAFHPDWSEHWANELEFSFEK
jgi:hypothetical protein